MTKKDIDDIISIICPNDDDFEKACISPAYLKKELESLALEQEPCEDCISRQAVDELSKELVHTTRDKADFLCNFWEGLRKLPPVTPKPKTDVLDKIRAEIDRQEKWLLQAGYTACNVDIAFDSIKSVLVESEN